jgi:hypothetical protein
MFEQDLAEARLFKGPTTDRESESHPAMIDF